MGAEEVEFGGGGGGRTLIPQHRSICPGGLGMAHANSRTHVAVEVVLYVGRWLFWRRNSTCVLWRLIGKSF